MEINQKKLFLFCILIIALFYAWYRYSHERLVKVALPEMEKIQLSNDYKLLYKKVISDVSCARVVERRIYGTNAFTPRQACDATIALINRSDLLDGQPQYMQEKCKFIKNEYKDKYSIDQAKPVSDRGYYRWGERFDGSGNLLPARYSGGDEVTLFSSVYSSLNDTKNLDKTLKFSSIHIADKYDKYAKNFNYKTYLSIRIQIVDMLGRGTSSPIFDLGLSDPDKEDPCGEKLYSEYIFDPSSNSYINLNKAIF